MATGLFLYRIVPPRPSFLADLSPAERKAMTDHVSFWTQKLIDGVAIVFGPVADPSGGWSMAIVKAAAAADVEAFGREDPVVAAGIATFAVWAMPNAMAVSG